MSQSTSATTQAPLALSFIADAYRRYPGECVHMRVRVDAQRAAPDGITVRVELPVGLTARSAASELQSGVEAPQIESFDRFSYVTWNISQPLPAGAYYECSLAATLDPTEADAELECRATAFVTGVEAERATEVLLIVVRAQAEYLRYLPSFFSHDVILNQWLMMFESFWAPIEKQIDQIDVYFDPKLSPQSFLNWLAGWIDLTLDARWPEAKQRALIRQAVSLYRKRGTKQGLQEFLQLYTGQAPEITEHRGMNFRLGPMGKLGMATALGLSNEAHTFSVHLRLPPVSASEGQHERLEAERRKMIEAIIASEKPAHTGYELKIETYLEKESASS